MIWVYGKTLQAITLARYKKEHNKLKHCLIICGVNSLKWNWQREVSKFCKNEKAIVLGTKQTRRGTYTNITLEETKQQIDSIPEEFFWIINIEKMRTSKKDIDSIPDHLNQLILKKELGMIVIDEVHKCIDYNSLIVTDKGRLKIGDIVQNKIECNVLSMNETSQILEFKPILNYYKNYIEDKVIMKVVTTNNELICTDDHKIFTLNRGWIAACELKIGDKVVEFNA